MARLRNRIWFVPTPNLQPLLPWGIVSFSWESSKSLESSTKRHQSFSQLNSLALPKARERVDSELINSWYKKRAKKLAKNSLINSWRVYMNVPASSIRFGYNNEFTSSGNLWLHFLKRIRLKFWWGSAMFLFFEGFQPQNTLSWRMGTFLTSADELLGIWNILIILLLRRAKLYNSMEHAIFFTKMTLHGCFSLQFENEPFIFTNKTDSD